MKAVIFDVEFPENEIRGGAGYSILEPRSAREIALKWLNRKAEMNEWWVDESRKDKIDARKKWAKDNTKTIENWRKSYRKAEK